MHVKIRKCFRWNWRKTRVYFFLAHFVDLVLFHQKIWIHNHISYFTHKENHPSDILSSSLVCLLRFIKNSDGKRKDRVTILFSASFFSYLKAFIEIWQSAINRIYLFYFVVQARIMNTWPFEEKHYFFLFIPIRCRVFVATLFIRFELFSFFGSP